MTAQGTAERPTSRSDWIWLLLPYALILATSVQVALTDAVAEAVLVRIILAGLALIIWHSFWAVLQRHWLERALLPMAVYYLGLVGLCTVLLDVSVTFLPLYLVCYTMAFVALPGAWAYVGLIVATAVPLIFSGTLGDGAPNLSITLGGLALAAIVGWSIRRLEAETTARKAALAELARAHSELERALAENIALQDRLVAEAHDAGVATERARLAAEIHDTLAAALTGIVSQLEALDAELPAQHPARTRVVASTDLARGGLREARGSIQALRPTALAGQRLDRALAELTEGSERTGHLPTQIHVTGTPVTIPAEVEDALLRIAQEALTNAQRHAGASQVHLTLSYLGHAVALDVADDGTGFDTGAARGHGLQIMSERAQAAGGDLEVRTGAGTTITATVPINGQGRAHD